MHSLLTPHGTLRAAINLGNPVLARRGPAGGEPGGVSVDLARAFAARLELPLQLVPFETAGPVVAAIARGEIDLAFLAVEPARAGVVHFCAPYVLIEGTYLTQANSPLRHVMDFDSAGTQIAVADKAAYDLFLTRTLIHAGLVRFATPDASLQGFLDQGLEAVAGIRQALDAFATSHPGLRVCPGRFMAIEQAMAIPRSHAAGAVVVETFLKEMKASGFVRRSLDAHGQSAVAIAP